MRSSADECRRPIPCGIDLFSGAGGFGLGFEAAGLPVVASLDKDADAVATLAANPPIGPRLVFHTDIRSFGPLAMDKAIEGLSPRYRVDFLIGGPPCQGWSRVGRGKLRSLGRIGSTPAPFAEERNRLYRPFLRYVSHFRPRVVLLENVRGMECYYGHDGTKAITTALDSLGYRTKVVPLDAADFGVPQQRRRLVIVGVREDLGLELDTPIGPPAGLGMDGAAPTVRDAIGDLPWVPSGNQRDVMPYRKLEDASAYLSLLRPGWMNGSVTAHITRPHRPEDREAFRSMKQGGIYSDLPDRLKRYRDDIFADKYRRLEWDKPSPCLTAHLAKDGYSHIHPSQTRTISVREAARIQGFPDWYVIAGSMGSQFRQIGNSVPPLLAYALAIAVRNFLGVKSEISWDVLSCSVLQTGTVTNE
ncbi:MAG: DNA cytosine methyltransferase [Thermoplasmata archaeon]